ncbi:autotransporter outer membrane beta-barrel domain-containing protein [Neisseria sp. Ec49-e6-T10]|uniref:autotransporter family protein n=1 Tax=Neisseria sp. Ec49-e6-T10 TaxID=3140744 RepID=UPI003EB7071E
MKKCDRSLLRGAYISSNYDVSSVKTPKKTFKTTQYLLSGLLATIFMSNGFAASYDHTGSVITNITAENGDTHNILGGTTVTPPNGQTGILVKDGGTVNINTSSNGNLTSVNVNDAYAVQVNNGGSISIGNTASTSTLEANSTGTSTAPSAVIRAAGANSTVTIQQTTINSIGDYNHAVYTSNNIQTTISGGMVSSVGTGSHGVYTRSGSEVVLDGTTVSTSGSRARGLHAQDRNTKITAHGITVNTTGNDAYAAFVFDQGHITLDGHSNLTTEGANAYGLTVNGGTAYAKNTNITTNGNDARGVNTVSNGSVVLDGGVTIHTHGTKAYGLFASNTGALITANSTHVTTENIDAYGAYADTGGKIELIGANHILTRGNAAYGLLSSGINAQLLSSGTNNLVETQGTDAHGVMVRNSGAANLIGTSVKTTGLNAHALNTRSLGQLNFNLTGGQLISIQGTSFFTEGGMIDATLDGTQVLNNGQLIDSGSDGISNGDIRLTVKNTTLNGNITAQQDSTASLSLVGTNWHGTATNGTDFELDNNSVWNMSASSDISTLHHAGRIHFSAPAGNHFNTLTIQNDYTGNEGTFYLNTKLDGDGSPSDQLVVSGDTNGSSQLHITNAGGMGALTVADGIEVVRVQGQSNGTFKLTNRVTAGLYEYELFQHGVESNAANGNWYLRSLLLPDNQPAIPTETTVYLRNLTTASTMFLHSLHDRLGEQSSNHDNKMDDQNKSSAWIRVANSHTNSKGGNGQVSLDTDTHLIHFGGDVASWANDHHHWAIGLMGAYGHSTIDASAKELPTTTSGLSRNAKGKIDGYSVGGYATWYQNTDKPTGAYIDGWLQYGWYKNKVQGNTQAEEHYNSHNWMASIEAGYALMASDQDSYQLFFEPQLQVAYTNYHADDHTDAGGTRITNNNADSVVTKLGVRMYSKSKNNSFIHFLEANWWHSDAKNTLAFDGQTMSDGTPHSRYELKAGLQGTFSKNWSLWGHVGGQWGENSYNRVEGMIGIKYLF